jgi:hypothetical protein
LATDEGPVQPCSGLTSGDCFVVWYDFNNPNIFPNSASTATTIYSLVTWNDAVNTGYTMNTIGLTGIDNGLITFDVISGDTSNQVLLSALTGTTLVIPSGDTRLHMTRVTGATGNFIYPIEFVQDPTFTVGDYVNLCGGFYQGYYKLDGTTYEILPVREHHAWSAEFWLKPSSTGCTGHTGTTLNDVYPNNKGFFFYMGTRAENKFWNQFNGVDSGCTSDCIIPSGCTDTLSPWCTIPKESEISILGDYGIAIPLDPPQVEIDIITNGFLIYGRAFDDGYKRLTGNTDSFIFTTASTEINTASTCTQCGTNHDGLGTQTACSYDGKGIVVVKTAKHKTNFQNPFLVYGRGAKSGATGSCTSCSGPDDNLGKETAYSFSGFTSPVDELDYKLDVIDNAIGFRIKDDGSIGYRLLTFTGYCITGTTGVTFVSGVTVQEEYSISGMVSADTWSYIAIRFVMPYLDDCDLKIKKPRKGNLMFYVNGRLKFIVHEFDEMVARRLGEYKSKQVGVPFNMSIGGGSQGLIESMTFDGQDPNDINLPIQENFAGTFIGGISQFKFNICDLSFCDIQHNYITDAIRYGVQNTDLILQENGFLILQENGYGIQY